MELVFLHGAGDSGAVWDLQIERFGDRYDALALDLPGHGERLTEPAFETVDENAEEAVRAIHTRGFQRPVLVGHSMGGATALAVALRWPSLPQGLVLVGSGARLRMRPEPIEEARQRAEAEMPGVVVPRVIALDQVVSTSAPAAVRGWLVDHFGRATAQATYADFLATNGFDAMGRLHQIRQPTLVIGGEDDLWTPTRFQHYLAEQISSARLVLLSDTGHYPFVERQMAFNQELEAFLVGLDGSTQATADG